MAGVQLIDVRKTYGDFVALESTSLEVRDGELLVLLGPSGCGKTTTLRMIAGFTEATSGTIRIGEDDVTHVPVYRRNVGVVFQNYALFPHLSVFENVAFGLRRRKRPADEIRRKVEEVLQLVRMDHLAQRYPRQLSGGQQQRVSIARALAIEPDVLLLDEPLSNLDAKLRLEVRREIRRLQRTLGITTILVTHDQDEAMSVGDRLVVMNQGAIQQIGTPREIYCRPVNDFVAGFIGSANFLEGHVSSDDDKVLRMPSGLALAVDFGHGTHRVIVRPEAIWLSAEGTPGMHAARIEEITYLGPTLDVLTRLDSGDELLVRLDSSRPEAAQLQPEGKVFLDIPVTAITRVQAA